MKRRRKKIKQRTNAWFGLIVVLVAVIIALGISLRVESPDQVYACDDSDSGDNPMEFGSTHDWRSGRSITDRCVDENTLQEFSCQRSIQDPRGKVAVKTYSCACDFGRCLAPDLEVVDIAFTEQPRVNQDFRVTFTIKNSGDLPVDNLDIETYFEPGFWLLVEAPELPLGPGATTTAVYSVKYGVPGSFSYVSVLDRYDLVLERDEFNNIRTENIIVK